MVKRNITVREGTDVKGSRVFEVVAAHNTTHYPMGDFLTQGEVNRAINGGITVKIQKTK